MSGTNQTRQHNDTKIAIRSILMCSSFRPRSVDVFCRFSRLETLSNDLKTLIWFFLNFRSRHEPPTREGEQIKMMREWRGGKLGLTPCERLHK